MDYHLTPAERAVVVLVAHGLGNKQTAEHLGLSVNTVKRHLSNIRYRWGTHSTAHIVGLAYRSGAIYVTPDDVAPEDAWTTRLRENGYELERRPERRNDRRHDAHQRRGEDR